MNPIKKRNHVLHTDKEFFIRINSLGRETTDVAAAADAVVAKVSDEMRAQSP